MKKRILFLDRDGTILVEPPDNYQVDRLDKFAFIPGAIGGLKRLFESGLYEFVLVTNQDGLGTDAHPEEQFWPYQNLMLSILESEGITFSAIHIDRTFKHENAPTRKPNLGLLQEYLNGEYDLERSFVIGDRPSDIQLAANLGAKGILLGRSQDNQDDLDLQPLATTLVLETSAWPEIVDFILNGAYRPRRGEVHRQTKETDIRVLVDLDAGPRSKVETGIGFFDHMLEQIARHGRLALEVTVKGDLHIDPHHSIEDTALALGEAFKQALGDKRGIERYGAATLPMDETLARVAIDFSGRPWLVWEADIPGDRVGEFPVEMAEHFFKSFSDAAACNLNVRVSGDNAHHMIEATFKGFARAIRQAIGFTPGDSSIPSTKGVL